MNMEKKPTIQVPTIVAIGLGAGILLALIIVATRPLNETESVLVAILLSAASMLGSWLVTHIYSQRNLENAIGQATEANKENIKNYAEKAAEKVLNLTNELSRLSDALSTAVEDSEDAENQKEAVMLLQERISAAVHNIGTLRSMNNTFLSDWRGVIGEEIERQHLLENQISELAEQLDVQKEERNSLRAQFVSPEDLENVEKLISKTEQRITESLKNLPFKVVSTKSKQKKRDISINCPNCSSEINTRFRNRKGGKKLLHCDNCNSYSQILGADDEEIQVTPVGTSEYEGACPLCTASVKAIVADWPGAMKNFRCANCDTELLISRAQDGFNIRPVRLYKYEVSQKVIDQVHELLPEERPWPTYIHKQIAQQLGYSNSLVTKVISRLITQGLYPLSNDETDKVTENDDEK